MIVKYTFVSQKAKQNFAVISVVSIFTFCLKKGYILSNRRTLICKVIGNDEKTYNLCDKTWRYILSWIIGIWCIDRLSRTEIR